MKPKEKETDAIADALTDLRKKFGDDAVMQDDGQIKDVEAIPTGCFAIDRLLGCGGLPKGRIIEVFGEESTGKTSVALAFAAQIQKNGGTCVLIDAEHSMDPEFTRNLGVDTKKLLVCQTSTLEQAMETIRAFVATNQVDLIIVDSVASLVPKAELEGEEMLKDSVALQARLMNKALRILTGEIARSRTICIFINHIRQKIGIAWGNPNTTPGGRALKFYASIRAEIKRGEKILGKGDAQIGNVVNITAVKNKVGFPWRKGSFELLYASGINKEADTLDTAEELNVIQKEGNTYTYGPSEKIGIGRDKAIDALKKNTELYAAVRKATEEAVKAEIVSRKKGE
jgi:recombination protein RecA